MKEDLSSKIVTSMHVVVSLYILRVVLYIFCKDFDVQNTYGLLAKREVKMAGY